MIRSLSLALPLLLLAVAGLFLLLRPDPVDRLVASEVERIGSAAMGSPVTLQRARVTLASGSVQLEGLKVTNPPGYRSKQALAVGRIDASIDTTLLDPRQIWLREVIINDAEATLEQGESGSNLQRLLERLSVRSADATGYSNGDQRQLVIDQLRLDGATVRLWEEDAGDARVIPLPGLELAYIGFTEGGLSGPDTAALILGAILTRALVAGAEPALRDLVEGYLPGPGRDLRELSGPDAESLRQLLEGGAPR